MSLSTEDVIDITSGMIKLCINVLNSDHITPEEQSLRYFTRKKFETIYVARMKRW